MGAPRLSQTFIEALKLGYQERGIKAFVPIVPLIIFVSPQFFASNILEFLNMKSPITFGPILGSMIVMGGFLGSVSINVLTQIFTLIGHEDFSDFLKEEGVLDIYLFWPQFAFIIQMIFIMVSVMSFIIFTIQGLSLLVVRIMLLDIGLLIYASWQTLGLIDMVRTLAWHRQNYLAIKSKESK